MTLHSLLSAERFPTCLRARLLPSCSPKTAFIGFALISRRLKREEASMNRSVLFLRKYISDRTATSSLISYRENPRFACLLSYNTIFPMKSGSVLYCKAIPKVVYEIVILRIIVEEHFHLPQHNRLILGFYLGNIQIYQREFAHQPERTLRSGQPGTKGV